MSLDSYQRRARRYFEALDQVGAASWERAGWSSAATQLRRWQVFSQLVEFRGLSVLDVGAGAGGFRTFLRKINSEPRRYLGLDLLESNCRSLATEAGVDVVVCGGIDALPEAESPDIATVSGVFNFPHKDWGAYFYEQISLIRQRTDLGVVANAIVTPCAWHRATRLFHEDGRRIVEHDSPGPGEFAALIV